LPVSKIYSNNFRSLKKEAKLYLWDWSELDLDPARFENCIASHLLKLVYFLQDRQGYRTQLHYLRSIEKKEVDFLVTIDKKPWFAVEAKLNDVKASPHLFYFRDKLKIPFSYQVVKQNGVDSFTNGVRIVSANRFLAGLV
jgi:predicted AAA+ superfamily ATPase